MQTFEMQIPDELAELMKRSKLGDRAPADQVRIALAIQLFQEGVISVGKAAEIAGEPRVAFELFLNEIGIPTVFYDEQAYEQDLRGIAEAEGRSQST